MSSAERRYFRLYITKPSSSGYLMLFDLIAKQETYNEQQIKEQLNGHPMARQLNVAKVYLKKKVLKALRSFYDEEGKQTELINGLRDLDILFKRGLYSMAEHELRRLEKLSKALENSVVEYQLITWKRRLIQATAPSSFDRLGAAVKEQGACLNELNKEQHYWLLALDAFSTNYAEKHPELLQLEYADRLQNKALLLHWQYGQSIVNGRQDGLDYLLPLLEEIRQKPTLSKEDPSLLLNTLNNIIAYHLFSKEYEAVKPWLQEIKQEYQALKQLSSSSAKLRLRTFNIELEICRDTLSFDNAEVLMSEIIEFSSVNQHLIPKAYQLSFWYQFAYLSFLKKDYSAALKWVNQLLNDPNVDVREDLHTHARLLNLMTHLELKNLFVLRYFVDSFRRFLKKRGAIARHEQALLSFFTKAGQQPSAEHLPLFKKLHSQLSEDGTHPLPPRFLGYTNILEWISSKMNALA